MELFGYEQWRRFEDAIKRAMISEKTSKRPGEHHFAEVGKMVELGSGSKRKIKDYKLTRYACYLIAMKAIHATNHSIEERDLYGEKSITVEHVQNNEGVRDLLGKRGIKPEDLPAEEDVKKLRRKVDGDKRKLERESKGVPSEE